MISRVCLVTGGNRGIGFALCTKLKDLGHVVILAARDKKKGQAVAKKLGVHFCLLDVTNEKSRLRCQKFIEQKFGRLDVLINNAGVFLDNVDPEVYETSAFQTTLAILRKTMDVNTYAAFRLCQLFIPLMIQNKYGRIVNVSSRFGQLSTMEGGDAAYRISKTALNAVTRIFAAEIKNENILINSVHPGWVRTEMGGTKAPLTPQQGAETIVWAALLPDGGSSGKFFSEKKEIGW